MTGTRETPGQKLWLSLYRADQYDQQAAAFTPLPTAGRMDPERATQKWLLGMSRHFKEGFPEKLRHAREASGLTQQQLSQIANLSVTGLAMIERGERAPSLDTAARICWALDVASENALQSACIFCGDPASRQGEHALPKAILKGWTGRDWFCEINGIPIPTRSGARRTSPHFPPYLLPACDRTTSQNDCNGTLNQLYEVPGKPVVRAVLDGSQALETPAQVVDLARWWIKTLLLLQHPACRFTFVVDTDPAFAHLQRLAWDLPASIYQNLVKGILPSDVSLWLATATSDDVEGREQLPELLRIYLPTTFDPEGGGGKPESLLWGCRQAGTPMLLFQLVIHPLCDFEHPFEQEGLAVRLWPDPPSRLEVGGLPVLGAEGRRQLGALFVDASFGENLPPGGWRAHVEAVQDGGSLGPPTLVAPDAHHA